MYKISYVFLCLVLLIQSCGQVSPKKEIYNKEFNWTITIPENFDTVSAEQWAKIQNRGVDAIEKTYDAKIQNNTKTIFVFKNGQLNYFESNYQPFDSSTDGNYLESCKKVNEQLYKTFVTQIPNVRLDTSTSTQIIDHLVFQTSKIIVTYPNKMVMNVLMYSRLFDTREFSVNIMYIDSVKGHSMLKSWENSRFSKK